METNLGSSPRTHIHMGGGKEELGETDRQTDGQMDGQRQKQNLSLNGKYCASGKYCVAQWCTPVVPALRSQRHEGQPDLHSETYSKVKQKP